MSKREKVELTRPELEDLLTILEECKREGWHYGRKDYWDRHLWNITVRVKYALYKFDKEEE